MATQKKPIRANSTRAKISWVEPFLLALFSYLIFLPYFGRWRLADDAYMGVLPFYQYQQRVMRLTGEWPQWITNVALGQPIGLAPGATWFYPPQVLWGLWLGWSEANYVTYLCLHVLAGSFLAFALGLKLGMTRAGAAIAAMAFVGNGYVIGSLSNPNLLIPYLFWPLLILGLVNLHRGARTGAAIATIGLGTYLIEVTGYPLVKLVIFGCTAFAYLSICRRMGLGMKWKPLAIAIGSAVLCAMPEWFTTLSSVGLADRLKKDIYNDITYGTSGNLITLATAVLPEMFTERMTQLGSTWLERSWWVGSVTLLSIGLAMRARLLSLGNFRIVGWIALFTLLFCIGGHSFIWELSASIFPPFNHLRHVSYVRFVPMAFLAFLAGLALTRMENAKVAAKSGFLALAWGVFVACIVGVAVYHRADLMNDLFNDRLYSHPQIGWKLALIHNSMYILLAFTAYEWASKSHEWARVFVILQLLSMADIAYASRRIVAAQNAYTPRSDFALASPLANARSTQKWNQGLDWITWQGNRPALYAYNTPQHKDYWAALSVEPAASLASTLVSCNAQRAQDSCQGVKFEVRRYYGNVIEVVGSGPAPAFIVAHDLMAPYWSASVNGQAAPLVPTYTYFKGAEVPAGNWTVRFEYRDPRYPFLWMGSALGFALLAFFGFRRGKYA